jgi:hypothetical protein
MEAMTPEEEAKWSGEDVEDIKETRRAIMRAIEESAEGGGDE